MTPVVHNFIGSFIADDDARHEILNMFDIGIVAQLKKLLPRNDAGFKHRLPAISRFLLNECIEIGCLAKLLRMFCSYR